MISWSGARRTVWTSTVVALLAGGPLGPFGLVHAGAEDDPGCTRAADRATAVASGPQFESLVAGPSSDHCAVCHWLHLLRGTTTGAGAAILAAPGAGGLAHPGGGSPSAASSFACSGRSPPSPVR